MNGLDYNEETAGVGGSDDIPFFPFFVTILQTLAMQFHTRVLPENTLLYISTISNFWMILLSAFSPFVAVLSLTM